MGNLFEDVVFCPRCSYALSKLERALLRAPLHKVPCPRCLCTNVADFYDYNSPEHHACRAAWERGEFAWAPPPVPPRGNNAGSTVSADILIRTVTQ